MAADDLTIDTLSLDDFRRTLQARLDEAFAALLALAPEQEHHGPALGGFHDAEQTAGRYDRLRQESIARLRRLINAVAAADRGTTDIAERYRTAEALNGAKAHEIADELRRVAEVLDGGRYHAR